MRPSWPLMLIQFLRTILKRALLSKPVLSTITNLGLAFKAAIDDSRESLSLDFVKHLFEYDIGLILAEDPNLQELSRTLTSTS